MSNDKIEEIKYISQRDHKEHIKYQTTCHNCGKVFEFAHKKRLQHEFLFCSKSCETEFRKNKSLNCVCPICKKRFHVDPYDLKKMVHEPCCSYKCMGIYRKTKYKGKNNPNYGNRGELNPLWKSDEKISSYGYILIRKINHPFANSDGYVFEHRLIAEQYLLTDDNSVEINGQKYLKPELIVHHKDENRINNDPNNLMIMTLAEHASIHSKERWQNKKNNIRKD